jgi:hypothetical protein
MKQINKIMIGEAEQNISLCHIPKGSTVHNGIVTTPTGETIDLNEKLKVLGYGVTQFATFKTEATVAQPENIPTPRTDANEARDEGLHGFVQSSFARQLERALTTAKANSEQHRQYAHMMQEQRSGIAEYCKKLEAQLASYEPPDRSTEE